MNSNLDPNSLIPDAGAVPRLIAFYLPQFHPTPENDAWWGKGFTEWTNVTKAGPQFDNHYQPHLPSDLGFYDLRVRETRHEQIALARDYGIDAFCYHYYWFSGSRLLHRPLDDMFADPQSDMPFCLCWANENWTRRWDATENQVLIAQRYLPDDDLNFIKGLVPYFEDSRYLRVGGKPLLIVYRPQQLPNPRRSAQVWREHCRSAGLGDIHICAALTHGNRNYQQFEFDSGVEFPPHSLEADRNLNASIDFYAPFGGNVLTFEAIASTYLDRRYQPGNVFRSVFPSWDNTARTGPRAFIALNGTPGNYEFWLAESIRRTMRDFPGEERLVFINAWNEWAEGCHLEPDRKYARQFLEATLRAKRLQSALDYFPDLERPIKHVTRRTLLGDLRNVLTYHASQMLGATRLRLNRHPRLKAMTARGLQILRTAQRVPAVRQTKVRHYFYNLSGMTVPLLIALAAFPVISRYAGPERLGFLGLAWAVIGYLGLLDLGLSRVVMRRVAQARTAQALSHERTVVAWVCVGLVALSAPAALLAGIFLPIGWVMGGEINPQLANEIQYSWWIMMATVPFVAVSGVLGGVLDGRQWFGWSNALKVVLGSWSFLAPMAVAVSGDATLPNMILMIAIGRVVATFANAIAAHFALPRHSRSGDDSPQPGFAAIAAEGGWMAMTNIVGPLMTRLDRFVVAANLTLGAAAFYIVPQELVLRLLLISVALGTTLFPTLARAHADDPRLHREVSQRGLRAACAISLPIALGLALLSSLGMGAWMGPKFAEQSTAVVAILAIGFFANSAAQIPYTALQTAGRADLIAKLHVTELPIFLAAVWLLTRQLGIDGAALAWSLRALVDFIGLLLLSRIPLQRGLILGVGLTFAAMLSVLLLPLGAQLIAGFAIFSLGLMLAFAWSRDVRAQLALAAQV